jgi:hypothetical protein
MSNIIAGRQRCWFVLVLMCGLLGCGANTADESIAEVNKTNLQRLANLYVRYQTQHQWQGPPSEEVFRQYIADTAPTTLERMGVDPAEVDQLFVSQVDDQPFKIRYGVPGNSRGSNDAIVFEVEGSDGVRRVGFTSMKVEDVEDDSRYAGLMDGSIKEPLTVPANSPANQ